MNLESCKQRLLVALLLVSTCTVCPIAKADRISTLKESLKSGNKQGCSEIILEGSESSKRPDR